MSDNLLNKTGIAFPSNENDSSHLCVDELREQLLAAQQEAAQYKKQSMELAIAVNAVRDFVTTDNESKDASLRRLKRIINQYQEDASDILADYITQKAQKEELEDDVQNIAACIGAGATLDDVCNLLFDLDCIKALLSNEQQHTP